MCITREEALVLYDWLARTNLIENPDRFADHAERQVLFNLECLLEELLVEPFDANYRELVARAREIVRGAER